jgi:peptidoglycan/xylan/chitin deacetylase (PgdA/CDA1 family)
MNNLRVVLLSDSRPSRVWQIANRITRELPGAKICGIVQRPVRYLPVAQQLIVKAGIRRTYASLPGRPKAHRWFHSLVEKLLYLALWWIHGFPPNLNSSNAVTAENLAEKCRHVGWPLLLAADLSDERVLDFVRQQRPNLAIVLGQFPVSPELAAVPSGGLIWASQSDVTTDGEPIEEGLQIRIEHHTKDSGAPFTVASLNVPSQPHDGVLGFTLKTDLIANDLLVQTAISLRSGSRAQASKEVTDWMHRILWPYFAQHERRSLKPGQTLPSCRRHRSVWKLCLDTLLLCSPYMVARNWYRRIDGKCPVLILGHHLVSDRGHRMGISTEVFWRQVQFLQRYYRIVSLSEAGELLHSGDIRVPTVVLTFDDGYADNFVNLRAVADETGIPVALFITTEPVGIHKEFQHDLENGNDGFLPLTWEQIRYWSLGEVEFGSHTHTHFDCGSTDRPTLSREIIGSKHDLENRLGKPVRFFAFPFGQHENLSAEAIDVAASAYPYFVSCFGGENLPVRRLNRRHFFRKQFYADAWELELELQSVFDLADTIKQRFSRCVDAVAFRGELRRFGFTGSSHVAPSRKGPGRYSSAGS